MNANRHNFIRGLRGRPVLVGVVVLLGAALVATRFWPGGTTTQASSFYEVKRGDFLVSVVEGGTLEAVKEVVVRSEVEGTARIINIVPEGSYVQKGDLLVELDSSSSQDTVDQQQMNVDKAQFAVLQAEQQLEIQKSVVESDIAAAELRVEFAGSDQEKYVKGAAVQALNNARIEITNVVETLKIAEERLTWTKKLFDQEFETKANLDRDLLAVSQGKLKQTQAETVLWMLETFDAPKQTRALTAALDEARTNLARVKMQGERRLAQFAADVETQKSGLALSKKKLERDLQQLKLTKIHAPQDGLVVYASPSGGGGRGGSDAMIEEGAVVRNRQELIKLPDIADMKLQVRIHESHINQVHVGQPAYIVLDSMPDERFNGFVNKVAPLPDSQSRWSNPNLKVYVTEILVTDELPDVKPGVSARAEVVITNMVNTLTVPIQAVTTRKGQQVVFLADAPQKPVPVEVGLYNNKFIEIVSGVKAGDRVLLAPPFDTDEKDLSGAVLAAGEKLPAGDTNATARALERTRNGNEDALIPSADGSLRARGESGDNAGDPATGERGARRSRGESEPGANRPNREELLKQFHTNGDGQLDETERGAMRGRGGGRSGRGGRSPHATETSGRDS